jgi:integrase
LDIPIVVNVNVLVHGHLRSLPMLLTGEGLDVSVLGFFTSVAVAALSPSSHAVSGRAIQRLFQARCIVDAPADPLSAPVWLNALAAGLQVGGHVHSTYPGSCSPLNKASSAAELGAAADFLIYLVDGGFLADQESRTWRNADRNGKAAFASAIRRKRSLLSHIVPSRPHRIVRGSLPTIPTPHARLISNGRKKKVAASAFPERHVVPFFMNGLCRRPGAELCADDLSQGGLARTLYLRDFLYFLLLCYGGGRASDYLHLYLDDIQYDYDTRQAVVFLYHPVSGPEPGAEHLVETGCPVRSRQAYLQEEFGQLPRNTGGKRHGYVGWKNLLLDEIVSRIGRRSRVYWQFPEIGQLFWILHEEYVRSVRPLNPGHPFYFVSESLGAYGQPWTLDGSRDSFERALRRIGLEPDAAQGLCRHGFRHRMGHWAVEHKLPPVVTQILFKHQSVRSQSAYSKLSPEKVSAMLSQAACADRPYKLEPDRGLPMLAGLGGAVLRRR